MVSLSLAAAAAMVCMSFVAALPAIATQPPTTRDLTTGADEALTTITLVSGDLVRVSEADGRTSVRMTPLAGRAGGFGYSQHVDGTGDHHLWPTQVIPLIGELLDPRLFDLTALERAGFADDRQALRLVVEHDGSAELPPGVDLVEAMPGADAWRVTVDVAGRHALGEALADAADDRDALAGITSIELDDAVRIAPEPGIESGSGEDARPRLTIELSAREPGADFRGALYLVSVDHDGVRRVWPVSHRRSTIELGVAKGTYRVVFQSEQLVDGRPALVDVSVTDFDVDGATTVRLDGADAAEVAVDVGRPYNRRDGMIGGTITSESEVVIIPFSTQINGVDGLRIFAAPTDPPSAGVHDFETIQNLVTDGASYHLRYLETQGIPADLVYAPAPRDLAKIDNTFHADVPGRDYLMQACYACQSWFTLEGSVFAVEVGNRHTAWATPGPWSLAVFAGDTEGEAGLQHEEDWAAGPRELTWFAAPVRPGSDRALVFLYYERLWFGVNSFMDPDYNSQALWYGLTPGLDTVWYEVRANGEVIATGDDDLRHDIFVPGGESQVDVRLEVDRDAPWWLSAPSTSTHWRFTINADIGGELVFPTMLQVDYGVETDLLNHAATPTEVDFHAFLPSSEGDTASIVSFEAWSSFDDGATWDVINLDDLGSGSFNGVVPDDRSCVDPCRVSLRVLAEDADGSTLEQTIIDAFERDGGPAPSPTLPPTGATDASRLMGVGTFALLAGALLIGLAARRVRRAA